MSSKASIIVVDRFGNEIDLTKLPPKPAGAAVNPLLISKEEAVARCGITVKQFDALVKEDIFPRPVPRTKMWDRKQFSNCLEIRKIRTDRVDAGYVYFIEMGDFIKIGYSTWPATRRDALQISCPYDLILLGAFPGALECEAGLHSLFAHLRARGEWFRKSAGLLAYIAWLKIAWRGNADVIAGDLDNVRPLVRRG